jgi:hypothetical protein
MPYPKLVEGNRVFDAAFDQESNYADWNELQDQLKGLLGPLTMAIPLIGANDVNNIVLNDWTYYSGATDPPFWQTVTDNSLLRIPIPWIRSGWKMTALYVNTQGNYQGDGGSDGSILLRRHLVNYAGVSPAAWSTVATCTGNFFQGIGGPFTPTWATYNAGALTLTLDGTYDYQLHVTSSNGGTMTACRILGAWATVQMGN